jgi:hypothetical protein
MFSMRKFSMLPKLMGRVTFPSGWIGRKLIPSNALVDNNYSVGVWSYLKSYVDRKFGLAPI